MGWDGIYDYMLPRKNGKVDRKGYLDKTFTWKSDDGNRSCEVLKSSMVGSVYYAAAKNQNGDIFAIVTLTAGKHSKNDSCGLWYKVMDETVGPYYWDCPASILDMLTPTQYESAKEWRKTCRERLALKAEERKHGKAPAPAIDGVSVEERRGSYIVTSASYRASSRYYGVRYAKRNFKSPAAAQRSFVEQYGTDEQKAALAAYEAKTA